MELPIGAQEEQTDFDGKKMAYATVYPKLPLRYKPPFRLNQLGPPLKTYTTQQRILFAESLQLPNKLADRRHQVTADT